MKSKIEKTLLPIMNLFDKFGSQWHLDDKPVFYPNMQIHRVVYSDSLGRRKSVRFDWEGRIIAGDQELGNLILQRTI